MYWPIGAPRVYAADLQSLPAIHNEPVNDESTIPIVVEARNTKNDGSASETARESIGKTSGEEKRKTTDGSRSHQRRTSAPKTGTRETNGAADAVKLDLKGRQEILAVCPSRNGNHFATITPNTLTIWQSQPTAAVATVWRSTQSITSYGANLHVFMRPDSATVVIQTTGDYLMTYTLAVDPSTRIYQPELSDDAPGSARRKSMFGKSQISADPFSGPGEGYGIQEISIQFNVVIKVDAGIAKALALEDELLIATERPPSIQCVRWVSDEASSRATTELLKSMPWISKGALVVDMIHDKPMNISAWITSDGQAYAVQRQSLKEKDSKDKPKGLFRGYAFHTPGSNLEHATRVAICARFSLMAVGCADGRISVYTARDYAGHIPLSHKLLAPGSQSLTGLITHMSYSPDGYALFVGYQNGWSMWSVYGKPLASSFHSDRLLAEGASETWLTAVKDAFWIGSGSQIVLLTPGESQLWILDVARSAVAGCFSSANVARSLVLTHSGFMIYRGYDLPDLGTTSLESGLWHHVQIPANYLHYQWPIRSAAISPDGRYVAVAGRRGLAHYSVTSGRWKTFDDPAMEDEFTVRGGMCWHQHVLIVAVESTDAFQIRVYSRESNLHNSNIMHLEHLPASIVLLAPSGQDSLLVYTQGNILYHYVIKATNSTVRLVQVGQIALHGIIRAPLRIRALSWILPEDQLENGDPSQDVAIATIVFLVDGKLVSLQPSTKDDGDLKYEMRIIAHNVEYYVLMRDQQYFTNSQLQPSQRAVRESAEDMGIAPFHQNDLRDSLWYFDGTDVHVWTDTQELLASASPELGRDLPIPVTVPVDFYPMSVLLNKGILFGIELDLSQRRDLSFSILRFVTRTQLFLPHILRQHLSQYNAPSALYISHHYQHLDYFAHALEVLLHTVLDDEVDSTPPADQALLPGVVSFLSSFPAFLDIVVQCTRKTEVRSWQTLFAHLPPPRDLFEQSLEKDNLKTAAGYLLVLHTLEELETDDRQAIRLLKRAKETQDWDLCKELARFLAALDNSGVKLREALEEVGLSATSNDVPHGLSNLTMNGSGPSP